MLCQMASVYWVGAGAGSAHDREVGALGFSMGSCSTQHDQCSGAAAKQDFRQSMAGVCAKHSPAPALLRVIPSTRETVLAGSV